LVKKFLPITCRPHYLRPNAQAGKRRKLHFSSWLRHCHASSCVIGRPCVVLIGPVSQCVRRATNTASATIQDMRVHHRRRNVHHVHLPTMTHDTRITLQRVDAADLSIQFDFWTPHVMRVGPTSRRRCPASAQRAASDERRKQNAMPRFFRVGWNQLCHPNVRPFVAQDG
jgi:hypothetical protein